LRDEKLKSKLFIVTFLFILTFSSYSTLLTSISPFPPILLLPALVQRHRALSDTPFTSHRSPTSDTASFPPSPSSRSLASLPPPSTLSSTHAPRHDFQLLIVCAYSPSRRRTTAPVLLDASLEPHIPCFLPSSACQGCSTPSADSERVQVLVRCVPGRSPAMRTSY
jgi:hypothetical protein